MKFFFSLATALQLALNGNQAYAMSSKEQNAFERELLDESHRDLTSIAYGTNFFVDSQNTYYDAYQTSWRYLGHMIKCGYPSDRYENGGSGSQDNQNYAGNNYCQRYIMWAAYVDPNYQGGGTGEYYYYDTDSGSYDKSACNTHGNGRCAPMDCHDSDTTTWNLMGIYKEAVWYGGDAFFEQLFKHEGVCIWNDDEAYEFMDESREQWTTGCVLSGTIDENGDYIYIDLKPSYNGNMYYGLFTDDVCKTEYNGNSVDVDTIASNMNLMSSSDIEQWNTYMEPFKVCQPCKTYNLNSGYSNSDNGGGEGDYDIDDDPNNGYFQCNDDAGYTNVNQCMKFRTHADLEIASWEDLVIGTEQGGILEIKVGQTYFGTPQVSDEEAEYLESLLKEKALAYQEEEKEYQALVKRARHSGTGMIIFGFLIMVSGAIALIGSIRWSIKRLDSPNRGNIMSEPLLVRKLAEANSLSLKAIRKFVMQDEEGEKV